MTIRHILSGQAASYVNGSGYTFAADDSTDGSNDGRTSHKKSVAISAISPSMKNVLPIKYCSWTFN